VLVQLTNYTKSGASYDHQLSVEPLTDPSGKVRAFQATSLLLRKPGEPRGAGIQPLLELPLISREPLPPLWPLLARAVRPDPPPGGALPSPASAPLPASAADGHGELDMEIMTWLESEHPSDLTAEMDLRSLVDETDNLSS
jgi:hypothetical protein